MKRFLALLIAVSLALTLCSCGLFEKVTAFSLYSKAYKTLKEAGGYEANCTIGVSFDIFGEPLGTDTQMNIKQNSESVQITSTVAGATVLTTYMYETVYVELEGTKIRYSASAETDGSLAEKLETIDIPELAKDLFESVEIVENEDKTKEISVSLTAEQASELLGSVTEDATLTLGNIVYTMKFSEDNELTNMYLVCDATTEILGVSLGGTISAEYEFVNFGTAPDIKLPSAYEEYEDGGEYVAE